MQYVRKHTPIVFVALLVASSAAMAQDNVIQEEDRVVERPQWIFRT